ncbi:MAG: hypothetical protein AAF721_07375 [Myxococcota bacterium]
MRTQASHDPRDAVECELCGLSCLRTAETCDRCEHQLGTAPDWPSLRQELVMLRGQIFLGSVITVGTVVGSVALLQGAGGFLALAPLGWALYGGYRYLILRGHVRRRAHD